MRTILRGAHVFTATTDAGEVLASHSVVIRDDRIEAVVPDDGLQIQDGDEVRDCSGRWIIPGMIDAHVHLAHDGTDVRQKYEPDPQVALRMHHNALQNLRSGVTTVRDLGAKNHIDISFRQAARLGLIVAPRVLVSGQPIIATGGHCTYMGREADGPDEVVKAVREQLKVGVDVVKLMVTGGVMTSGTDPRTQQLTDEEIAAAVRIAHQANRPVAAHVQGGPGIKAAILAGVDTLEHGMFLTDEDIELMLEHRSYYVPTLSAIRQIAEDGERIGLPADAVEKARRATAAHFESCRRAIEAGVTIVAGTDYRHGTFDLELRDLVTCGLSPAQALIAGTRTAAEACRVADDLGSIEPGKLADLVILGADPTADIAAVTEVEAVILGGRTVWDRGHWLVP